MERSFTRLLSVTVQINEKFWNEPWRKSKKHTKYIQWNSVQNMVISFFSFIFVQIFSNHSTVLYPHLWCSCYLTINCDTGQHSQFLRCLNSKPCYILNCDPKMFKPFLNDAKLPKVDYWFWFLWYMSNICEVICKKHEGGVWQIWNFVCWPISLCQKEK